jgi:hypothetical protein
MKRYYIEFFSGEFTIHKVDHPEHTYIKADSAEEAAKSVITNIEASRKEPCEVIRIEECI